MKLTADERDVRDEAAFRDQQQAELDAEQEGREVGRAGGHAGLMPNYPSAAERKAWMLGWQAAMLAKMARAA